MKKATEQKANDQIRKALKEYDIPQWKLAELLGIGETTLTRRLRRELPEDETKRILSVIKGGVNA